MKRSLLLSSIALVLAGVSTVALAASDHRGPGHERGPRAHGGHAFKQADANGDGQISRAEFLAASEKRASQMFDRLDANGDGVVNQAEREKAHERAREKAQEFRAKAGERKAGK